MAMHDRVFSRRCLNRASLAQTFVRLGAHVGAVVLLLADLRRLSLCHTWLCTALFATVYSSALFDAIPSCPHALSWTVLRTYDSYPSTQSPDALFSIILKPPTGVFTATDRRFTTPDLRFSTHHVGVFLFRFYLRGFPKRRLGVFLPPTGGPKHRPRFSRTPTGFQSEFSPSYTSNSLGLLHPSQSAFAASNHEVRLWSEADTGRNSKCMHIFG